MYVHERSREWQDQSLQSFQECFTQIQEISQAIERVRGLGYATHLPPPKIPVPKKKKCGGDYHHHFQGSLEFLGVATSCSIIVPYQVSDVEFLNITLDFTFNGNYIKSEKTCFFFIFTSKYILTYWFFTSYQLKLCSMIVNVRFSYSLIS